MLVVLGYLACEVVAFAFPAWLASRSDEGSCVAMLLWPVLAVALPVLLALAAQP